MNKLILAGLLSALCFSNVSHADEKICQNQMLGSHASQLCILKRPYQHQYYFLSVDGEVVFALPDDYVEDVTLVHRIPKDAAIEFPLSNQRTPTVTISGGCMPISEDQEIDGKEVGVEIGRTCSFNWGSVPIVKDLNFKFNP